MKENFLKYKKKLKIKITRSVDIETPDPDSIYIFFVFDFETKMTKKAFSLICLWSFFSFKYFSKCPLKTQF